MEDFDFENIDITEYDPDDFDWDAVFGEDEPEFDDAILDQPVGEYEDDEENDNPNFGVTEPRDPKPKGPGPGHAKSPNEDRELVLV